MDDRIKKVLYQIALLCLKILHWAIEPGSLALFDLMQQLAVPSRNGKTMRRSPLKRLVRAIDWIPSKSSRETVSALVADAQVDLKKYRKQRRHILVRWRSFCTWAVVLYLGKR